MNSSIYGYLIIFCAIVEEKSIAAAARKLEIASPSVSNALKALEQHIGLPLFNRSTRKIELTAAGNQLYQNSRPAMQELNEAFENVVNTSKAPSGLIKITVPRIAYLLILKPHFAKFCKLYPDIKLEISVNDSAVDIIKEGFDLGIRFGNSIDDTMVAHKLYISPAGKNKGIIAGLYASQDYINNFGSPKNIDELQHHKIIGFRLMTANKLIPLILSSGTEHITVKAQNSFIANSLEVVIDAIRQGIGIGRVFEPILQLENDVDKFIPILQKYWKTYPPLSLYYMQNSQKTKKIKVLIDFLLETNLLK